MSDQIYDGSIGDLVNVPTAAERKAARVAVLREGHAAGLHVGYKSVLDCPDCAPTEIIPESERQLGIAARALDRLIGLAFMAHVDDPDAKSGPEMAVASERFVQAVGDYVLSRLHHNGGYGVRPIVIDETVQQAYLSRLVEIRKGNEAETCIGALIAAFQAAGVEVVSEGSTIKPDYGVADHCLRATWR